MSKNFYELLGIDPGASADEIKRAFRREIAKYHPDKVQHLGKEFQEIAAVRSAELTRAYKTLTDEASRAEYDEDVEPSAAPASRPQPAAPPREDPAPAQPRPVATEPSPRTGRPADAAGAGDLVRRAAIVRFRQAVSEEFGRCDDAALPGFEVACSPPKGRFWSKTPPRILMRFVPRVDGAAIAESWGLAARTHSGGDQRESCVFVMGPLVAPVPELARAIAEEMRKPSAAKVVMIPVNTRTWSADIPKDAPPAVRTLVAKLKSL